MYRMNSQSRVLEEAFMRSGLPYQIIGGVRFYERKEIKDALAHLRLAQNPHDTFSLDRIINNTPAGKGIGPKTLDQLREWARDTGLSLYDAMISLTKDEGKQPLDVRANRLLSGLAHLVSDLVARREEM